MISEIIKELNTMQKASVTTSELVLIWAKEIEVWRSQRTMLTSIQENKTLTWSGTRRHQMRTWIGAIHKESPREDVNTVAQCATVQKRCAGCGKNNQFHKVCKNPTKRVPKEKLREAQREQYMIQKDSDTSDLELAVVRTKSFSFLIVRSLLITKLK